MSSKDEAPATSKAVAARRRNAKARRERVLGDGGRRLEMLLQADATAALERLEAKAGPGATATSVISGLLLRAAKRAR